MKYCLGDVGRKLCHITGGQSRAPGMPDKDHLLDADLLPDRFQISDGTRDRVVPQMGQKSGKTASRLIVEKDSESVGCEAAIDILIEWTLSHPRSTMQVDDGFGLYRNSLWRIVLAVGDHRSSRQLPVLGVRIRNSFREMGSRGPQH